MKTKIIVSKIMLIALVLNYFSSAAQNQTSPEASGAINIQYMVRSEYRHGFQALADTNQKPGIFTSQRARLGYQ